MEKRRTFKQWFFSEPREEIKRYSDPNGTPPPTAASVMAATYAKTAVTLKESLSISAVYSAINILVNWTTQMELEVYRDSTEIDAPTFIKYPKIDAVRNIVTVSQYQLVRETVTSLALTGNGYWLVKRRDSDDFPNELEVLNPLAMSVEVIDGKTYFNYTGWNRPVRYTDDEVTHIKYFSVPGRLTGLSPIEANGASLAAVLALREYANNWFSKTGTVRQHFKYKKYLNEEQHAAWVAEMNRQKASQDGDVHTSSDTDIANLGLNPSEALYLDQQQFNVTEIARLFGIPAGMLLADSGATGLTYQNLSTDARLFVTNTLSGYMNPIQDALTRLLPRGQTVRFRTEALLQADTQDRYEAYKTGIEAGFLSIDEVREKEGLPPLNEGDAPAAAA